MSTPLDQKKTGPKDVFFHLLSIIFLYVSVVSFGTLLFQYINIYFPDVLHGDYGRSARGALRFPIATLFVVFPLFVWLNSYLQRDLVKNPERRELKIRRWLLYFTLFAATLVIVGDLVTLIWRFLGGEITPRFILKVITILAIAAAVFVYYGWNLRKEIPASRHPRMKLFTQGIVGLGALAIIAGFFIAGSPQSARAREMDERRVNDLSRIQSEIVNYWQAKEKLPAVLSDLNEPLRGFTAPLDPETGESYEYRQTGDLSFELCANFKTSNREENNSGTAKPAVPTRPYGEPGLDENWLHDAVRACFTRTIDPAFFPPFKELK